MTQSFPFLWIAKKNQSLTQLMGSDLKNIQSTLYSHGAIMFRGFDVDSQEKLEKVVSSYPGDSMDYIDGNSPRTKLDKKVYTSTEHPAELFISLHNELSYSKSWPGQLFFCCVTPAEKGGATLIADSRKILEKLSSETLSAFREKGVRYIRNLHSGIGSGPSWQTTFEAETRAEVEEVCKKDDIQFSWQDDGSVRVYQNRPAIHIHPETKEEVWFNQADQFHPSTNPEEVFLALMEIYEDDLHCMPQYASFANGDEIPLEMLEEVREVAAQCTVDFPWEKGDLMLVDNVLAAHGRSPFEGDRLVLVAMSK